MPRTGRPWIASRRRTRTTSICSIRRSWASGRPNPGRADSHRSAGRFVARLQRYMQKAIKEAKTHTSWFNQNRPYEDAVSRFVESDAHGPRGAGFLSTFVPFVRRVAAAGMMNSLSQLVLKSASPGVPDFYQGTETWQLDMADPDNRRPVDFAARAAMLDELMPWILRAESEERTGTGPDGRARAVRGLHCWPLAGRPHQDVRDGLRVGFRRREPRCSSRAITSRCVEKARRPIASWRSRDFTRASR